jgi:heme-degrading monooxygenase HmoA
MVLEVAILQIKEGKSAAFEESFQKASQLIHYKPFPTVAHYQ